MKKHVMNLTPSPLNLIREGKKTIELRLYDEKRKKIKTGDIITFINTEDKEDTLTVRVMDLYIFDSFEELYNTLSLFECGYTEDDISTASPKDMELYYPKEKQELYGVVGIKISLGIKEIKVGQSGAAVYDIDDTQILKLINREEIGNEKFNTYLREALLYQSLCPKTYLPKVQDIEISQDEIVLTMKKYKALDKKNINDDLIRKIAYVLVCIHTTEIPDFVMCDKKDFDTLSEEDIQKCIDGWNSVIEEHPGVFDRKPLIDISENINNIILWHNSEDKVLSHGDFHWDNLLTDENGHIIVCDWQGVNTAGASDDICFLFSRLNADGILIDRNVFLKYYADEIFRKTGIIPKTDELEQHIQASNVITTFMYWHYYLHGNPVERVQEIYGNMVLMSKNVIKNPKEKCAMYNDIDVSEKQIKSGKIKNARHSLAAKNIQ